MASDDGMDTFGAFHNRSHLKALRKELEEGERIAAAAEASLLAYDGLLAATDRRLLFVAKRPLGRKVWSIRYRDVTRSEFHMDAHAAMVEVADGGQELAITNIQRDGGRRIGVALDTGLRRARSKAAAPEAPAPGSRFTAKEARERLERLEAMLSRGSMTPAEFAVARRKLLEEAQVEDPRGSEDIRVVGPGEKPVRVHDFKGRAR